MFEQSPRTNSPLPGEVTHLLQMFEVGCGAGGGRYASSATLTPDLRVANRRSSSFQLAVQANSS
jgi:hypothetical protein